MGRAETVLFTVDKDNTCRIGVPPAAPSDNYARRALVLGKLENASHIFFNPKGQMFVVRGEELYKGPTASSPWKDWFSLAKRVGKSDWDKFKFLYFNPAGKLFAVTKAGAWYRGPEPSNEHVPWLYKEAAKIGGSDWQLFHTLFFDPESVMYGVVEDKLVKGRPLSTTDGTWLANTINVGKSGWSERTHFMGISSAGNLFCVSKNDGNMYTASPPTHKDDAWLQRARLVGSGYNVYKCLAFTEDKTIQKIIKVDFLTDIGKILEMEPQTVSEKVYDNKDSTTTLKSTFEVNKVEIAESTFTHDHGFEFSAEAEVTFETKIPLISSSSIRMSAKTSTSHKMSFTDLNRNEIHLLISSTFEVEPGKAVRQIAVIKKAKIDVPYCATICTIFGHETTICGTWKGSTFYDLKIVQEDA